MEEVVPVLLYVLWTAVSLGQVQQARQLLVEGTDVEEKAGPNASTPLHEAVSHGCQEMVRLWVEHGADVSVKNNDGETPLHAVCEQLEMVVPAKYWESYNEIGDVPWSNNSLTRADAHQEALEIVRLLRHHHVDFSAKETKKTCLPSGVIFLNSDS
jgi:hypothetical protein